MRHALTLSLALLLSAPIAGAQTSPPTTATATTPPAVAPAKTKAAGAKTTAKKAGTRKATAKKAAETSGKGKTAAKPETRTLQDIHIEGEIPVPQVLFITARDQRRFVDFQHQRYLKTSQEVGQQTALPSRLVVTGGGQADPTKESRP